MIDCDTCRVRGPACQECVVTVLLGTGAETFDLDDTERTAVAALAEAGLIPPLRLVPACTHSDRLTTPGRELTG